MASNCGYCKGHIVSQEFEYLQCGSKCGRKFHVTCIGVDRVAYQFLISNSNFFWHCNFCIKVSAKDEKDDTIKILESKVKELNLQLSQLTVQLHQRDEQQAQLQQQLQRQQWQQSQQSQQYQQNPMQLQQQFQLPQQQFQLPQQQQQQQQYQQKEKQTQPQQRQQQRQHSEQRGKDKQQKQKEKQTQPQQQQQQQRQQSEQKGKDKQQKQIPAKNMNKPMEQNSKTEHDSKKKEKKNQIGNLQRNDEDATPKTELPSEEKKLELATHLEFHIEKILMQQVAENDFMGVMDENVILKKMYDLVELSKYGPKKIDAKLRDLHKLQQNLENMSKNDIALAYKEEGNFYLLHKKFHTALYCFSAGLDLKCSNKELMANLHNNRSTGLFLLQEYGKAIVESQLANYYKPNYYKALKRTALCAANWDDHDLCIEMCNKTLAQNKDDNVAKELLKKSQAVKSNEMSKLAQRQLLKMLLERDIRTGPTMASPDKVPEVYMELKSKTLVWPVKFIHYPSLITYKRLVGEDVALKYCLNDHYTKEKLLLWYWADVTRSFQVVNREHTLLQIMREESFWYNRSELIFHVARNHDALTNSGVPQLGQEINLHKRVNRGLKI